MRSHLFSLNTTLSDHNRSLTSWRTIVRSAVHAQSSRFPCVELAVILTIWNSRRCLDSSLKVTLLPEAFRAATSPSEKVEVAGVFKRFLDVESARKMELQRHSGGRLEQRVLSRSILGASLSLGTSSSAVNEAAGEDVPSQSTVSLGSSAKEDSDPMNEVSAQKESVSNNEGSAKKDSGSENQGSAAFKQESGTQDIRTSPAPEGEAEEESETTADIGSRSPSSSAEPAVSSPTAKQVRSRRPNPFAAMSFSRPEERLRVNIPKPRPILSTVFPLVNEFNAVEAFPKLPPAAPLTFKDVLVKPPPLLPTQTAQKTVPTNPLADTDYPASLYRQGHTRPKVFSAGVCARCQGPHETLDRQWCYNCFEVCKRKGDGKSRCEKKACSHPIGHSTEDCDLGDFRDHPDNPRLPRHLIDFARPWAADNPKQPRPLYYYRPRGREVPQYCPELPPRYQEEGLPGGLVNVSQGTVYCVENAIHMCDGHWKPLPWGAERHGKDAARKPRETKPHRGGPPRAGKQPRWQQKRWRRQALAQKGVLEQVVKEP